MASSSARRTEVRLALEALVQLGGSLTDCVELLKAMGTKSARCPRCRGTGKTEPWRACTWCRPWYDAEDRGYGVFDIYAGKRSTIPIHVTEVLNLASKASP